MGIELDIDRIGDIFVENDIFEKENIHFYCFVNAVERCIYTIDYIKGVVYKNE